MHNLAQYQVCPCLWDLFFVDGTSLLGVYLAKSPGETKYRYALQILPGSVKIMDIADAEILAAVDPSKINFEC